MMVIEPEDREYTGSFTIEPETDEEIEAMAKLLDIPVLRPTDGPWEGHPFILIDDR